MARNKQDDSYPAEWKGVKLLDSPGLKPQPGISLYSPIEFITPPFSPIKPPPPLDLGKPEKPPKALMKEIRRTMGPRLGLPKEKYKLPDEVGDSKPEFIIPGELAKAAHLDGCLKLIGESNAGTIGDRSSDLQN